MSPRRLLPYVIGLLVLTFALGSLPRGPAGGSLLFDSYWLLYLVYLGPVAFLAIMIALVILIGLNWKELGTGLGTGMARKRAAKKPRSRYSFIISLIVWLAAVMVLVERPGSIFNSTQPTTQTVKDIVGSNTAPSNPFVAGGFLPTISSLISSNAFGVVFLGLVAVGSVVVIQAFRVSMRETDKNAIQELEAKQVKGLRAVNDAIKLINNETLDPRNRIIACYQRMIVTVSGLGTQVSVDQTARELERAIRSTLALKGPATSQLTQLFEEARYSIHDVGDNDAANAREYLESIAEELKVHLDI